MFRLLARSIGGRALRHAVTGGKRPPLLDFKLGFSLLRDKRVPLTNKALALLLSVLALVVLNALELPVEILIAALLNLPGVGFDMMIEGVEILAGPILFASLFILRLAPADLVRQLRFERYRIVPDVARITMEDAHYRSEPAMAARQIVRKRT